MTDHRELLIAVDAMGGDNAPREIIRGALQGALEYGCSIALVGRAAVLEPELAAIEGAESAARGQVRIVEAAEVIEMDEHPATAVRSKKDASVVRACQLVASGDAAAAVSAGNSGATLAAALFALKRIDGVARPAIGTGIPTPNGETFLLDVGTNTDCKPEWLAQFALMGTVYARAMMGVDKPRVGLLSIGEEPGKGNQLVLDAFPLLQQVLDRPDVAFVGNVEGKELFKDAVDVAVCDGFVGNVALKVAEGAGEFLFATMRDQAMASASGKLGGLLLKSKLRAIRDRVDYRHTGGALLLGVAGEVVIAHGRSDALAIKNAIRVARKAVLANVHGVIATEFAVALSKSVQPVTS